MLKKYVDQGAKGFGEHKPGVRFDDPLNMTIYAACGQLKLPVLFHLDEQRNMDAPGLPGLENALKQKPQHSIHWPRPRLVGFDRPATSSKRTWLVIPKGPRPSWWCDRRPDGPVSEPARRPVGRQRSPSHFARRRVRSDPPPPIRRADRRMFGTDYLAPCLKRFRNSPCFAPCNCPPTSRPASSATMPASSWVSPDGDLPHNIPLRITTESP